MVEAGYKKVPAEQLRAVCYPEEFSVINEKEETSEGDSIIGQDRAVHALEFGLKIKSQGFNIFASGMPGTGKETAVKEYVDKVAREAPVPSDLCYVNNFKDPYRPKSLSLPAGRGVELAKDIKNLIEAVKSDIPRAFESDEYMAQKEKITRSYNEQKQELFNQLNQEAMEKGFIIQSSPAGFLFVPQRDGTPLQEKDIAQLSDEEKKEIFDKRAELEERLKAVMRQVKNIDRQASEDIKKLDREVTLFAVEHLFHDLQEKYRDLSEVASYLNEMKEDIVENANQFRQDEQQKQQLPAFLGSIPAPWAQEPQFKKYEVNVVVDNSKLEGAPVISEMNPTYNNIFGRIEKETQFGGLVTDFTMIRSGSLHQANGGFFVVNIEDLLKNIFAWESLKRVLKTKKLDIEEAGERLGFISTKSLRPEPVPLDVKVILIGPPLFYHLLFIYDPEFRELFKVKAEFDVVMARKPENIRSYSYFIDTFCHKESLMPLDPSAMAKIVEYGSRLAEDKYKLSTRFAEIADVVREACYYAGSTSCEKVKAEHISSAIEAKIYRSNLIQEKLQEMMERDVLLIDTGGEAVGQLNGLSVMHIGDFSFGRPNRITCSLALGREGIIDIEREARLGGRLHTKGVMILSGYLSSRYAREAPLTLAARLVFEQSYSEVEGDSASSAELYILLSSLADLPLRQDLAVTGSVNQKGEIQAIGGVNEKVEGFFELCRARRLTGTQGVIIPASNEQNLMLKEEVVEAVREGNFHIYTVHTVDEGIELLTGVKAGQRLEDGTYEKDSVNSRVEKALLSLAEQMKNFGTEKAKKKGEEKAGENEEEKRGEETEEEE